MPPPRPPIQQRHFDWASISLPGLEAWLSHRSVYMICFVLRNRFFPPTKLLPSIQPLVPDWQNFHDHCACDHIAIYSLKINTTLRCTWSLIFVGLDVPQPPVVDGNFGTNSNVLCTCSGTLRTGTSNYCWFSENEAPPTIFTINCAVKMEFCCSNL